MSINEYLLQQDDSLKQLRNEYKSRLESVRLLQNCLQDKQRDLFSFIAENQEDFNRLYK